MSFLCAAPSSQGSIGSHAVTLVWKAARHLRPLYKHLCQLGFPAPPGSSHTLLTDRQWLPTAWTLSPSLPVPSTIQDSSSSAIPDPLCVPTSLDMLTSGVPPTECCSLFPCYFHLHSNLTPSSMAQQSLLFFICTSKRSSLLPELTSLQSPLFGGLRLQISIPDILGSAHHHTLCPCGTLDGYTALVSLSDTWPNTSSSSCDGCEV